MIVLESHTLGAIVAKNVMGATNNFLIGILSPIPQDGIYSWHCYWGQEPV